MGRAANARAASQAHLFCVMRGSHDRTQNRQRVQFGLGPRAKNLKAEMPKDRGNNGDSEVLQSDNVCDCRGERLAASSCRRKLAHQEIGVEEENDESDLYGGSHMTITRRVHFCYFSSPASWPTTQNLRCIR
jgi:hypothetical protein